MQLFSADAMVFSKNFRFFFDPEKVKKRASKAAHNRPRPFYFTAQPRPQPTAHSPQPTAHSPELIFHIMKSRDQTSVLLSVTSTSAHRVLHNMKFLTKEQFSHTIKNPHPYPKGYWAMALNKFSCEVSMNYKSSSFVLSVEFKSRLYWIPTLTPRVNVPWCQIN